MSKRPFTEMYRSMDYHSDAPIVVLMGTSTAGKTSICNEIIKQDQESGGPSEVCVWGVDLEATGPYRQECLALLAGNEKFEAIKGHFGDDYNIVLAMYQLPIKGNGQKYTLPLYDPSDEQFEKDLVSFSKATGGRYDPDKVRILRELVKENPKDFRAAMDLSDLDLAKRSIDKAVKNSKLGIPTILDFGPEKERPIEIFTDYLKELGHNGPVRIVLVHVPIEELIKRGIKRNEDSGKEGGDPNNYRDISALVEQYSRLYGDIGEESGAEVLYTLPARSLDESVLATLRSGDTSKEDRHLESEEGSTVELKIGIRKGIGLVDIVYDHEEGSTTKIASEIHGWILQEMEKVKDSSTFVKKTGCKTVDDLSDNKSSWRDILTKDSGRSKDDSTIIRR